MSCVDDKGAFVENYRVSFPGWGGGYGRGLGASEDKRSFSVICGMAAKKVRCNPALLMARISQEVSELRLRDPILLQTLDPRTEHEYVTRSSDFISRHRRDCPNRELIEVPGFQGILNSGGINLPVFDVFVRDEKQTGFVILIDLQKALRWIHYCPTMVPGDELSVRDELLIRVIDLNQDVMRREKLIAEAPKWLDEKPDRQEYLRSRVIVNVYEKFWIEVLDPTACTSFQVVEAEELAEQAAATPAEGIFDAVVDPPEAEVDLSVEFEEEIQNPPLQEKE